MRLWGLSMLKNENCRPQKAMPKNENMTVFSSNLAQVQTTQFIDTSEDISIVKLANKIDKQRFNSEPRSLTSAGYFIPKRDQQNMSSISAHTHIENEDLKLSYLNEQRLKLEKKLIFDGQLSRDEARTLSLIDQKLFTDSYRETHEDAEINEFLGNSDRVDSLIKMMVKHGKNSSS